MLIYTLSLVRLAEDVSGFILPYELISPLTMTIITGVIIPFPMLPKVPNNISNLSTLSAYLNMPPFPLISMANKDGARGG